MSMACRIVEAGSVGAVGPVGVVAPECDAAAVPPAEFVEDEETSRLRHVVIAIEFGERHIAS